MLSVYKGDRGLLKQKKLEPSGPGDLWAAQGVAEGQEIFLRRESRSSRLVTYSWLNADSLEVERQMPAYPYLYEYRGFPMQAVVVADESSVYGRSSSGIQMIDKEQQFKTICDAKLCRGDGHLETLYSHYFGVSAQTGIAVIDRVHGLVWSKSVERRYRNNLIQFGSMRSAMSATRFCLWVTAYRKAVFDGVKITSSPTLLLYDAVSPKVPVAIPIKPVEGWWDYALSPSGNRLAVFNGAKVLVYSLN
jgi:hypothetical protein